MKRIFFHREKDQTNNFSAIYIKDLLTTGKNLEKQPIPLLRISLQIHFTWLFEQVMVEK